MEDVTQAEILEARRLNQLHDLSLGVDQMTRGIVVARTRFDGDVLLGMLWVSADGFSVAVGHKLPDEAQRLEARAYWNDVWARRRKAELEAESPEMHPSADAKCPR